MGQVVELFDSRTQKISDNIAERSTCTFVYLATQFNDEVDVVNAVGSVAPAMYQNMVFHTIEVFERINQNSWRVKVNYVAPPATVVQYDSTGGTQHVTQSIATVNSYGPDASDQLGGAIGFDGENVAGVDKVIPIFNWIETHSLTDAELDVASYYALTGKVNSDNFQGYNPGEVLFNGAFAQEREDGLWEVQLKFSYQPNKDNLSVGTITGISKKGWEYLWVYYAKSIDTTAKVKIPKPSAVYIEQIYEYASFGPLDL